jgi:hypothetical protein
MRFTLDYRGVLTSTYFDTLGPKAKETETRRDVIETNKGHGLICMINKTIMIRTSPKKQFKILSSWLSITDALLTDALKYLNRLYTVSQL